MVTVHGTWSPAAEWTKEDSDLLKQVTAAVKGCGLYRFCWSGLNGLTPRLEASDALQAELDKLPSTAPIVVIGHSHGGNIIAWASTKLTRRLKAAVYLNAPFIQARKPRNHNSAQLTLWASMFLPVPAYLIVYPPGRISPLGVLVSILSAMLTANMLSSWFTRRLPITADRLEVVSVPDRKIQSELSVFSSGDEIGTLFALAFGSQWLLNRVFVWAGLGCLAALLPAVIATHFDWPAKWLLAGLVLGSLGVIILSWAATFALNLFTYGLEQGLIGLDADVTGTPAPRGQVGMYTVPWPAIITEKGLRHSNVCEDPKVIAHVSRWLETLD